MKNAQLQEELKKMKIENQRLREMLSQATNNFNSLQMQLVAVMRQQEQRNSSQDHILVIYIDLLITWLISIHFYKKYTFIYCLCRL